MVPERLPPVSLSYAHRRSADAGRGLRVCAATAGPVDGFDARYGHEWHERHGEYGLQHGGDGGSYVHDVAAAEAAWGRGEGQGGGGAGEGVHRALQGLSQGFGRRIRD